MCVCCGGGGGGGGGWGVRWVGESLSDHGILRSYVSREINYGR